MPDDVVDEEERKPSRWRIISTLGYALAAIIVGVILSGLQSNRAAIADLRGDLERVEADVLVRIEALEDQLSQTTQELAQRFEAEVARLDESNRNRRDSIATLEVATASNAAQIDELRRDIERLLPFGSDTPEVPAP